MNQSVFRRTALVVTSFIALTLSGLAAAEPPSRAARLGYISGTVSFSPAGEPDWFRAVVNRPLTSGDRLWSDANSRAELQIGSTTLFTTCTATPPSNQYVTATCSQGSFGVLGSDTAYVPCPVPSTNQYVSVLCIAGSSTGVGTKRITCMYQ